MDGKEMPFLRDIDNDALFAARLENVFQLTYEALTEALAKFPLVEASDVIDDWFRNDGELGQTYERLARMRHQMALHIRDMADRRRRLGDAARGLADVEFEKD